MQELVIKCDYCKRELIKKEFFIEIRELRKTSFLDKKYHFCDRHCLIAYLNSQGEKNEE